MAERRFQSNSQSALKKKLDSLKYPQPLGVDSVPLVEALLADLLKTAEGFTQLKKQLSDANSKIQSLTDCVIPLQNELSLIQKKNNELHLHLMTTKEDFDSKTSFWRASMTRLEEENSDLNFYTKKLKDDLAKQASANSDLRTKLDAVLGKTYAASKNLAEPGLGKNQVFELNKVVAPSAGSLFVKPDSVWANELRVADERSRKLQEEVEVQRRAKNLAEDDAKRLNVMLENRNLEITRLAGMIGTDFKPEMITTKYRESVRSANVDQMNDRIDLLNKENAKLEAELSKARQGLDRFFELEKENKFMVDNVADLRSQNHSLMLKLSELERLGKGLSLSPDLERLKSQNQELTSQINSLQNEVSRLQDEQKQVERLRSSQSADKQAYSEAIFRVNQERDELRQQVAEFEDLLTQTQQELSLAREREKLSTGQAANLKREIESIQQTYSRINKDHLSTTEESYQLRQRLAALESQKNVLQAEVETSEFEVQRLGKIKKMTEDQLDEAKKEISSLRTEQNALLAQKLKISVLLEASQKDLTSIKEENLHLVRLREKDKQAIIEAEERERDLNGQLSAALHNNRVIQKEHQNISDELVGKMDDMRRVAMMKASYEQELAELRPFKMKYQQLAEESNSLKASALNKESTHSKLQRQVDALEDSLRLKEISLGEQARLSAKYQEEIARLENEIEDIKEHAALLNSNVRQTEYLHSETAALKQQINDYREKERESVRQGEQLKAELKKAADTIRAMQKQMARTAEQKTSLEQDLEKLKYSLGELQSKDISGQTEQVKLEERVFQADIMVEELKRQVGLEQHNRYRAEDEVSALKSILDNEKNNSNRLLEQNSQLKSLISNLEKMKEELLKKISSFSSDKSLDEDHKSQLGSEISQLRKELASKTSEACKLQEALRSVDQERDYIQSLLDQKTEENHAVESALLASNKDLALLKDSLNSLQSKDSVSHKRFEEKDFQLKKMSERTKHQENELEDLKAALAGQGRQVQELNEHLVALTKENSYVNEQLMKVTHEKDNLKKYFDDKSRNERLTQQMARSVEREKEDLLLTYKKACEENERLNAAVSSVAVEQRETYAKLQACELELVNAQNHISMQEHEIFNLQQETNTLERQVSHLTLQLETAEKKSQEVQEIKESFMREVSSARQIALNVEASKDDLIRKFSAVENEKLILESKIRSLQSEISAVRTQSEFEKQKADELQVVLAKERETLFKTQKDLGRLEVSRGADDEYAASQFQSTRNQLMNMEMENLKLKEENGRITHKLHKYEGKIKDYETQMNKTNAAYRYADDWDS